MSLLLTSILGGEMSQVESLISPTGHRLARGHLICSRDRI